MEADFTRVIVSLSGTPSTAIVHHRDFPEIRAEGGSPKEAAIYLVNKLDCTLDSALTDWRRETLGHAVADVKAFIEHQA
jgi:hypothetical protein